jgi:hypothetical protein
MPPLPDNDVTVYLVLNNYRTGLAYVETAGGDDPRKLRRRH